MSTPMGDLLILWPVGAVSTLIVSVGFLAMFREGLTSSWANHRQQARRDCRLALIGVAIAPIWFIAVPALVLWWLYRLFHETITLTFREDNR